MLRFTRTILGRGLPVAAILALASHASAQPVNDVCAAAATILPGQPVSGTISGAAADGSCSCGFPTGRDVFYRLTAAAEGVHRVSLCQGSRWDSVVSVHDGCPANVLNQWACDDEGCRPPGQPGSGFLSTTSVFLRSGGTCIIRVAAFDSSVIPSAYTLLVEPPVEPTGACCHAGQCTIITGAQCASLEGVYLGNWSACLGAGEVVAEQSLSFGAGLPIPDDAPAGVSSTLNIQSAAMLGDVEVWLSLEHPFIGDLRITLTHGAQTATLLSRIGGGELGDNSSLDGEYWFGDAQNNSLWLAARNAAIGQIVAPGVYRATDEQGTVVRLRGIFGGLPAAGPWTITATDLVEFGVGHILAWGLILRESSGEICEGGIGACCLGNGSICIPYTRGQCVVSGGVFAGESLPCQNMPDNPLGCCPANFDMQGGITVSDIFAFLERWFGSDITADFDGDESVTVLDIFAFLESWFLGCAVQMTGGPGACCLPGPGPGESTVCSVRAQAQCLFAGGTWRGEGVPCEQGAGNPTACCAANFDGQNGVTPIDIFAYLTAWFAGDSAAEFDGTGRIDTADIFAFLTAFFAGCP